MRCFGTCHGGPYTGRKMVHFFAPDTEPVIRVAVEKDGYSIRAVPGMQASTRIRPVLFGEYRFDPGESIWHWEPGESLELIRPEPVNK